MYTFTKSERLCKKQLTKKVFADGISLKSDCFRIFYSEAFNQQEKLKIQIEKLEAIGGSSAIVPSEGLVFKYKGKIYKFTGAFAPINQIWGSLKF